MKKTTTIYLNLFRHSGAGRNPAKQHPAQRTKPLSRDARNTSTNWIPACAGMTQVFGRSGFNPTFRTTSLILALAAIGLTTLPTHNAYANPQGGQIVAGSATIVQETAAKVGITQTTDKAIIDWQKYSIGANEHVQYYQPSAASVTLNRVVGQDPSQILGRLTANGQVFLVNPNGIFFGKNAQIDVAGLVASTHNIRNDDFLVGRNNFNIPGNPGAAVINEGNIRIADTGIAAFVAPSVANRGVIAARLGKIMLASANGFTLDFTGDQLITFLVNDSVAQTAFDLEGKQLTSFVENAGRIEAQGGYVLLTAKAAENVVHSVINQSGSIEATTVGTQSGTIILSGGQHGQVDDSGTLDVSGPENGQSAGRIDVSGNRLFLNSASLIAVGDEQGGMVRIGGAFQGGKTSTTSTELMEGFISRWGNILPIDNAQTTAIDANSNIDVSSKNGDGGSVIVWSDKETTHLGKIKASGQQGGFVEISSSDKLFRVNLLGVEGASNILLDPQNLTIGNTSLWTAHVSTLNGVEPAENLADVIANGMLHIPSSLSGNSYYWSSFNLNLLQGYDGDNFKLEVRVKNPIVGGGISAYDTGFSVSSSMNPTNATGVAFMDGSWAAYYASVMANGSSQNNQSSLVRDLQDWHTLAFETINGVMNVYYDGTQVKQQSYTGNIGQVDLISLSTKGSGSVDWVRGYSNGQLVLDENFNSAPIPTGNSSNVADQTFTSSPGLDATVSAADVATVLSAGTALTMQATNDISVESAIRATPVSGNGGNLTLQAGRDIRINADISTSGGNVNLLAGWDQGTNAAGINTGAVDINGATISSGTGNIMIAGRGSATLTDPWNSGQNGVLIRDSAVVQATTGNVTVAGTGVGAWGMGVDVEGSKVTSSDGDVRITGTSGYCSSCYALVSGVIVNRNVSTASEISVTGSGGLLIDGTASDATWSYGVNVGSGGSIRHTGMPATGKMFDVVGHGGHAGHMSYGVSMGGNGYLSTHNAPLTVNGTAGIADGYDSFGVGAANQDVAYFISTGSGTITLVGTPGSSAGNGRYGIAFGGNSYNGEEPGYIQTAGAAVNFYSDSIYVRNQTTFGPYIRGTSTINIQPRSDYVPPVQEPGLTPAQTLLVQQHQNDNASMLLIAIGNGLFQNSTSDPVWVGMYQNGSATPAQITANGLWLTYDIYRSATESRILEGLANGDIVYGEAIWTALGSSNQTNRNAAYYTYTHPLPISTLTTAQQQLVNMYEGKPADHLFWALVDTPPQFTNAPTDPVWSALYVSGSATQAQRDANAWKNTFDNYRNAGMATLLQALKDGVLKGEGYDVSVWEALTETNPNTRTALASYMTYLANNSQTLPNDPTRDIAANKPNQTVTAVYDPYSGFEENRGWIYLGDAAGTVVSFNDLVSVRKLAHSEDYSFALMQDGRLDPTKLSDTQVRQFLNDAMELNVQYLDQHQLSETASKALAGINDANAKVNELATKTTREASAPNSSEIMAINKEIAFSTVGAIADLYSGGMTAAPRAAGAVTKILNEGKNWSKLIAGDYGTTSAKSYLAVKEFADFIDSKEAKIAMALISSGIDFSATDYDSQQTVGAAVDLLKIGGPSVETMFKDIPISRFLNTFAGESSKVAVNLATSLLKEGITNGLNGAAKEIVLSVAEAIPIVGNVVAVYNKVQDINDQVSARTDRNNQAVSAAVEDLSVLINKVNSEISREKLNALLSLENHAH